jgi:hypothetical protein
MAVDYVMTIDSEDEEVVDNLSKNAQEEANLNPEFIFDVAGDPYLEVTSHTLAEDVVKSGSKPVRSQKPLFENLSPFWYRFLCLLTTLLLGAG